MALRAQLLAINEMAEINAAYTAALGKLGTTIEDASSRVEAGLVASFESQFTKLAADVAALASNEGNEKLAAKQLQMLKAGIAMASKAALALDKAEGIKSDGAALKIVAGLPRPKAVAVAGGKKAARKKR